MKRKEVGGMTHELIERLRVQPLLYQDQRCITLPMVDLLHERPEDTAGRNFRSHAERFQEGKHFFRVPYVVWSQWDNGPTQYVGPKTEGRGGHRGPMILLTERGYCTPV